jgi:hypothetical protein
MPYDSEGQWVCPDDGVLNPGHHWVRMGSSAIGTRILRMTDDYECRDCRRKVMVIREDEPGGR